MGKRPHSCEHFLSFGCDYSAGSQVGLAALAQRKSMGLPALTE